ncbi:maleylpyruvate isomerase family mycothiol-dependent enzyme [Nakamurella sp. GG22]
MPGLLPVDDLVTVLRTESATLAEEAQRVLLSDRVPSCPDWTVRELLEHLGGVQRWAATIVAQARTKLPDGTEEAKLFTAPDRDLLPWFQIGAATLATALESAPPDLAAFVFLKNAPPPRHFWARRQAHEATIHRVDALAARLGRIPSTAEAGIGTDLAVDGIDELVTGFVPRRSSRLRTDEPFTVSIAPTDADVSWTIRVSDQPPVVVGGSDHDAHSVITGSAAAIYLGLWNRGDDIAENGTVDALGHWRQQVRVSWN